jgi:predicted nucleotidyltransferase
LQLTQLLQKNAGVKWASLGVSGSVLTGLHTSTSDIDLLIYGSRNCEKVYKALTSLVKEKSSHVKSYVAEELKTLFDFRSKDTIMSFEDCVRTESKKVLQGKFHQRDYFIRCVKEWTEINEHYGSVHYEPLGDAKISATIVDDSQMIFTPCIYSIEDVKLLEGCKVESLSEIASFRGRFCEQARIGEKVIAYGKVERVKKLEDGAESFRLLLGNKPADYMILAE